ncbi:hypothetical protein Mapa_012319 [Marchantia paleacea]|nr:hypothetical protein Mapa_012319 [Marchantia paleacea]
MGHQQGNGHVKAHHLLHERRQICTPGNIRLGDQVITSQNGVQLIAHLLEYIGIIAQLSNAPFDRPQRGLYGGDVNVLHDVQNVVGVYLSLLLGLEDVVHRHLLARLLLRLASLEDLLALVQEVLLEDRQPLVLELLAILEVLAQEWPQDGDEVAVVVLEALGQSTPLAVHGGQPDEKLVVHGLEPPVEHHAVHDVVHHELKSSSDYAARGGRCRIRLQILNHVVDLVFPCEPGLLDHLVGEEGHGHNSTHSSPVVTVHGEHHVLSISCEDVEHDIPRSGPEFHALCVQNLLGELWARNSHVVLHSHL